MTKEQFAAQVETMIANLEAIKAASGFGAGTAWAFDQHDYPLAVCECAAAVSGNDATFAKMFNRKFRTDACSMMFERALQAIAA
jgi:hypothetical protein